MATPPNVGFKPVEEEEGKDGKEGRDIVLELMKNFRRSGQEIVTANFSPLVTL